MHRFQTTILVAAFALTAFTAPELSQGRPTVREAVQAGSVTSIAALPLRFESTERGAESGGFVAQAPGYSVSVTATGLALTVRSATPVSPRRLEAVRPVVARSTRKRTLQLSFVGAAPRARGMAAERLSGRANYFFGSDPAKWRADVPLYGRVRFENVYPGIDTVYYGKDGRLEFDFVVAPGADTRAIRMRLTEPQDDPIGLGSLHIDRSGDLVVQTDAGNLRVHAPVVYQMDGCCTKEHVDGAFVLDRDGEVGFAIGEHDRSRPLVIDPVLTYSTYVGGTATDYGTFIAVDASRNVYVTGFTDSLNFPAPNPPPSANAAFVIKLNASGALVYATYLAGTISGVSGLSPDNVGNGIAVDGAGRAYVTGTTNASDFPTVNAFDTSFNNGFARGDAFVSKLSADGSSLEYSTYLGSFNDDEGFAIAVDSHDSAYVTGLTWCPGQFPRSDNAFQPGCVTGQGHDAFVTKLYTLASGEDSLIYSTHLATAGNEFGNSISVDPVRGVAYITGFTDATDFPTTTSIYPAITEGLHGFVTAVKEDGTDLYYSTLVGSGFSETTGIVLSGTQLFVTGFTDGVDFPIKNASQPTYGGGIRDAFVMWLNPQASGPDSVLFSTFLGGAGDDVANGLALGAGVWVGGSTTGGFPTTANAQQPTYGGGFADAFVARVIPNGLSPGELRYGSFLGGSGEDAVFGIATGGSKQAYLTGSTFSSDFPTANAFQGARVGSASDAFVTSVAFFPDISLATVPPVTVSTGGTASVPVSVTSIDEWDDLVKLEVFGQSTGGSLPPGITFQWAPTGSFAASNEFKPPPNGVASSTLTIRADALLTPGTYTLWLYVNPLAYVTPISVTVVASAMGTSMAVSAIHQAGCIDSTGIEHALLSKLDAAEAAAGRGDTRSAINTHNALLHQILAQRAKHIATTCTIDGITFDPAALLAADVRSLIANLKVAAVANPIMGYVASSTGAGVSRATVSLIDASSTVIASATTDVSGFYYFATTGLLVPGATYTVSVTGLPAGLTSVTPSSQPFVWNNAAITLEQFLAL